MIADEYNIEYFKFIRDEIIKRVQLHYRLVTSKVILSGALFAFLWTKNPSENAADENFLSAFLVTAIFCFLFDFIMLENLGWIRSAGNYIKQNIENENLPLICWESHFAQASEPDKKWSYIRWPWRCFSACSYLLGVWGIGFLLWLGHAIIKFDATNKADVICFIFASYLMPYTFWLVLRNLAGDVPMHSKPPKTPLKWNKTLKK